MSRNPPNPQTQPQKSILKKPSGTSVPTPGQVEPTRAKFDEMNIIETLHPADKDYGHMKIDEPKTPYNYVDENATSSGGLSSADHNFLIQKLTESAAAPPRATRSLSSVSANDPDSDSEPVNEEFISKRKSHYNEFQAIQKARQLIQQEEEEQDPKKKGGPGCCGKKK